VERQCLYCQPEHPILAAPGELIGSVIARWVIARWVIARWVIARWVIERWVIERWGDRAIG
jgi:hypothetical protein